MKNLHNLRRTSSPASRLALGCAVVATACTLAACGDSDLAAPSTQYGDKPALPAPQNFLVPPMKVPSAESWKAGEAP